MTTQFSHDFSALEEADFSIGSGEKKFEKMNYLGGSKQTWPIDVRILVNMINQDEAKPMHHNHYHEYIDANNNYVRIPCPRSIGMTCPICDAHWGNKEKAEKLQTIGANAEGHEKHAEWKKAETLAKLFKQKKSFSLLVALRGDSKVSILESKPMLTKAIFGDSYKQEPGAVADIKAFGASVYVPHEPTGWLTLSKSGTGLSTRYSARPSMNVKVNGRKKSEELVEEDLHPSILEKFKTMEELPKLSEMIRNKMWSEVDYENYVASDGTQLPAAELEKLQKRRGYRGGADGQTSSEPASEVASFNQDSDDFDPF